VDPTTRRRRRHRKKSVDDPLVPIRGARVKALLDVFDIREKEASRRLGGLKPPVRITQQGVNKLISRRNGRCRASLRHGLARGLGVPEDWLAGERHRLPGAAMPLLEKVALLRWNVAAAVQALRKPIDLIAAARPLEQLLVLMQGRSGVQARYSGLALPQEIQEMHGVVEGLLKHVRAGRTRSKAFGRDVRLLGELDQRLRDKASCDRWFGSLIDPDTIPTLDVAWSALFVASRGAWLRQSGNGEIDSAGAEVLAILDALLWQRWRGLLLSAPRGDPPEEEPASISEAVLRRFRVLTQLLGPWLEGEADLDTTRLRVLYECLVNRGPAK